MAARDLNLCIWEMVLGVDRAGLSCRKGRNKNGLFRPIRQALPAEKAIFVAQTDYSCTKPDIFPAAAGVSPGIRSGSCGSRMRRLPPAYGG